MEHDVDRAFWRRYARTSQVLNLVIVAIDLAYVLATWESGARRPLLLGMNLAALVGILGSLASSPEERLAVSRYRDVVFGAWCMFGCVVVTFAVWADGGVSSPLAWLFALSVMFTAMVHRPALVAVSGVGAVAGFAIVASLDGSLTEEPAAVLVRLAYLLALTYAAGTAAHFRWSHHDDQVALREQLSALADCDGLTGLYNHRAFHEQLHRATAVEAGAEPVPVAVLMLDLDHFKTVNDRHGHVVGDEVLRAVTAAIQASIRPCDIAARIGGEEFAVLLPGAAPETAGEIAERLRAAVDRIEEPVPVTASIGVTSSHTGVDGAELLERADSALYEAKRRGRNRVCWLHAA